MINKAAEALFIYHVSGGTVLILSSPLKQLTILFNLVNDVGGFFCMVVSIKKKRSEYMEASLHFSSFNRCICYSWKEKKLIKKDAMILGCIIKVSH